MNNVYDIAHELCRSLKETDQYKNYERAKKKVDANSAVSKMINDFHQVNQEFQTKTLMSGGEQDPELLNRIQRNI